MKHPLDGVAGAALAHGAGAAPSRVVPQDGCHNCKFLHVQPNGRVAECRRNPPTPFLIPSGEGQMSGVKMWPPISPQDWCGEHKPKLAIARSI